MFQSALRWVRVRRSLQVVGTSQSQRAGLLSYCTLAAILFSSVPTEAQQPELAIELNKLEVQDGKCRAYFVVNNKSDKNYQKLKLDLVLFRSDGVISRRFALDLAPVRAQKQTVKIFDIADISCDEVGSFLVNELLECEAEGGPIADCLKDISLSSLAEAKLAK